MYAADTGSLWGGFLGGIFTSAAVAGAFVFYFRGGKDTFDKWRQGGSAGVAGTVVNKVIEVGSSVTARAYDALGSLTPRGGGGGMASSRSYTAGSSFGSGGGGGGGSSSGGLSSSGGGGYGAT